MTPLIDRLGKRLLVVPNGCWEFQGSRTKYGYGQIRTGQKDTKRRAHRIMWEIVFGPIPEGLHVLHKCDNPPCCRPSHLFLGTQADNNADRDAKGRNNQASGEQHGSAKLTWGQVNAIRADSRIRRLIATDYGVSKSTITRIKKHILWKEAS